MAICNGCNGVLGIDCFNTQECQQITASMASQSSYDEGYAAGYEAGRASLPSAQPSDVVKIRRPLEDMIAAIDKGAIGSFNIQNEDGETWTFHDEWRSWANTALLALDALSTTQQAQSVQKLVEAVQWFLTDNSDSGEVRAIHAMQDALAPFTANKE